MTWQPIESAPKNVDFLVHLSTGYITRGRLLSGKYFGADSMGQERGAEPTHWMPLPAPPEPSK